MSPDPLDPDPVQTRIQRAIGPGYELLRVLGYGGMGQVWLARETALRRLVAVKALHPVLSASEEARRRFRRECETAAQLDHPGVVPVHQIGEGGDIAWFTMAYVEGETLADRLEREGRLPLAEALRVARQVADALAAAHRRGFVHRDVKPQNLLLERGSGRVLVSDFGIARALRPLPEDGDTLTLAGSVIGTPRYMSPEQALGRSDVGAPSDLYSLGIILYEMIAGAYPYDVVEGSTAASIHLTSEVVWLAAREPSIPGLVDDLVRRMLDKDPAARPTAADLVAALDALGVGQGGETPVAGAATLVAARRRWILLAVVGAGLVLAVGMVVRAQRGTVPASPALPGRVRVNFVVEDPATGRALWADSADAHPDSVPAAFDRLRGRLPEGLAR